MAGVTKTLTFAEGTEVSAPVQSFLQTSSFSTYATDADYVTAKGSPATEGDSYGNTTDNKVHYFDGTNWTALNNINNKFNATAAPTPNDDSANTSTNGIFSIGSMWVDVDSDKFYICVDATATVAVWSSGGGGGGGAANFDLVGNADEAKSDLSEFSTGAGGFDNPSGPIAGTFVLSEIAADIIDGAKVYKFTTGNASDYVARDSIAIPQGRRGRYLYGEFEYKWEGNNSNDIIEWNVKDETNNKILETFNVETYWDTTNNTSMKFTYNFWCPEDCEAVLVGPKCESFSAAKIFIWQKHILNDDPFKEVSLRDRQAVRYTRFAGHGSTATKIPYFTTALQNDGAQILEITNNSTDGFSARALRDCDVNVSLNAGSSVMELGTSLNGVVTTSIGALSDIQRLTFTSLSAGSTRDSQTTSIRMYAGDVWRPHSEGVIGTVYSTAWNLSLVATAATTHVVSHSAGVENEFVIDIANNGSTTVITRISDPDNNPLDDVTPVSRASTGRLILYLKSGFFVVTPDAKGVCTETDAFIWTQAANNSTTSLDIRTYNTAGSAIDVNCSVTIKRMESDYKKPNAYAVTPFENICYLKEIKTSGSDAGTFTQGTWITRQLTDLNSNGESGNNGSSFCSLSANQITLGKGEYELTAWCPAYQVNANKAALYNVTDSNYDFYSASAFNAGDSNECAVLICRFNLISSKVFEIRHRCQATRASVGLGRASSGTAIPGHETYTQVRIRKIR